jgi:signal peptidase
LKDYLFLDKKYKVISRYLIALFILVCLLQYEATNIFSQKIYAIINDYLLVSLFCILLIISILFIIPKVHASGKVAEREKLLFDSLIYAIILTAIRYVAGIFIYSLGKSPYDLSFLGVLNNIIRLLPIIIVRELVRSYTLNTYCKKKIKGSFYIITTLLVLCEVNWFTLNTLTDMEKITVYLSENIGPLICEGILLSYLAFYGGAAASLIFAIFMYIFHWIIPILPNLNWLSNGIIGMIVPILEVSIFINKYQPKNNRLHYLINSKKEIINTTLTITFSVLLIWFVVGVFPIYPSVIATGSMEPLICPGDVIIIEKVTEAQDIYKLKCGDVIQFKRDDILITHRIVEIIKDKKGTLKFRTKGDNNSGADVQNVLAEDIKGTLVNVIPKIGYPTLWLKERRTIDREDIQF